MFQLSGNHREWPKQFCISADFLLYFKRFSVTYPGSCKLNQLCSYNFFIMFTSERVFVKLVSYLIYLKKFCKPINHHDYFRMVLDTIIAILKSHCLLKNLILGYQNVKSQILIILKVISFKKSFLPLPSLIWISLYVDDPYLSDSRDFFYLTKYDKIYIIIEDSLSFWIAEPKSSIRYI